MAVGVVMAAPCLLVPMLTQGSGDKDKPLSRQYWLVANVWIAIFSFVGNYVWTHYFYVLLGAAYTFPSWQLNKVKMVSCADCLCTNLTACYPAGAHWLVLDDACLLLLLPCPRQRLHTVRTRPS